MNADDPQQVLRVTLDEVERVARADISPLPQQPSPAAKSYGNIAQPADPVLAQENGSIFLQAWFYLGSAGLVGSLLGWGLAERGFVDGERDRWGNTWMVPMIVTLMCVGFAVAESLIERSGKKVLTRGALSLPLGIAFGFVFDAIANTFYALALAICSAAGAQTFHNPAVWLARGFAWAVFGAAGGIVYGIVGRSMKKTAFGVLGGAIGAVLGGTIFDPISFATHGGAASRAIGFGLLGLATGVGMGLVENALKDRWLYVTAGPLAGKQFILYKPQTTIGSDQSCDIYLFKDPQIEPDHAVLQLKASRVYLLAKGVAYISGQPVRGPQILESGVILQMGRYSFRYQEKER
jgi:type III secretion system (T3SS) inner membrane Yop/YscD-like protein